MAHDGGFMFNDKTSLMKQLRTKTGFHRLPTPYSMEQIYDEVIKTSTIPTFSTYFPKEMKIPVDLNQIRVPHDRDAFQGDQSDIYEIPPIFPPESDRFIVGIQSLDPYNDMRYQALSSTYETIESYQALAVAQGAANLASVIEPPVITEFIEPNRFRLSTGYYYRDRVILTLEISYSAEAFDIPRKYRKAFSKLALLDLQQFLYETLKFEDGTPTALADMQLFVNRWENAGAERAELINAWDTKESGLVKLPMAWI